MRVSDIVSSVDADLDEDVDYGYALVVSQDVRSGNISVQPFSVRSVLEAPGTAGDPTLQPRDRVLFFRNVAVEELAASEAERLGPDGDGQSARAVEASSGQAAGDLGEAGAVSGPGMEGQARTATRDGQAGGAYMAGAAGYGQYGPYASYGPYAGYGTYGPAAAYGDYAGDENFEDTTGRRDRGRYGSGENATARERDEPPSRQEMLAPIIARLEAQASPEAPVRIVSVSGAVHAPGDYPLSEGDSVGELLAAAGGLRDDAFLRSAELRRVVTDEATGRALVRNLGVDLEATGDDGRAFVLASRDHLHVRRIPDWRPRDTVVIEGEVRFPGTYVIGPGDTFGDLLERAGGLTEQGFAEGIVFTRQSLREQEARETRRFIGELRKNIAAATLTLEGSQISDFAGIEELAESLMDSETLGRLIVDAPRVLLGDESADVQLQAGDRIRVPPRVRSVTVIGEVQRAGSYRYQERYGVEDYLATSAGMTRRADESRMYILRANGEIDLIEDRRWFAFDLADTGVRPGDTIVVPIDTTYRNTLDYWSTLTQIAYQSGIALAALLAI
jgi:protein involved in polysaccharide export with SLBB domain